MITKYKVIYFVPSDSHVCGGYTTPREFDTSAEANDFAQEQSELHPEHKPFIFESHYREPGDPPPKCEGCDLVLPDDSDSDYCQDCCEHEYDWDEGYTCEFCGAEGDVGAAIDDAMYRFEDR